MLWFPIMNGSAHDWFLLVFNPSSGYPQWHCVLALRRPHARYILEDLI